MSNMNLGEETEYIEFNSSYALLFKGHGELCYWAQTNTKIV